MKIAKVVLTTLVLVGVAASIPAASAKKHSKSHSMSMKKGSSAGESSQGNVGPGTNNPPATK
jgi:hypothetical protein